MHPLLPADAELIARWHYEGRYTVYDGLAGRESESVQYLHPRNSFRAVRCASGFVGFCSFGVDGRVPGGTYDHDALDVGWGMAPELVGNGQGHAFLSAIVEYATCELNAVRLRATIASWNRRALRAARGIGFRPISTFRTDQGSEFTILLRESSHALPG